MKRQFFFAGLITVALHRLLRSARSGGQSPSNCSMVATSPVGRRCSIPPIRRVTRVVRADRLLICTGEPLGVLQTERAFTNFRLVVEYRWPPGQKPGNSGILTRINGPVRALPRAAEVQLMHGNAGDVLGLQGMQVLDGQPRFFAVNAHEIAGDIRGVKKLVDAEKPPGEWNRVEVLAEGGSYTVWMNGQPINHAVGVEIRPGPIGLQSEGGEIHFRRATLTPLAP